MLFESRKVAHARFSGFIGGIVSVNRIISPFRDKRLLFQFPSCLRLVEPMPSKNQQ
ncbi:hypothetical protein HanPSC8_Chr15g0656011 [Helianthus annuus]|nr:hypothetical protein HanPSC8_Chr15g0656011 [Helianthus annuus]